MCRSAPPAATSSPQTGRHILDLYGGHAVAALGYAHPRLVQAISEQSQRLLFQSNAVALDIRAEATEKLLSVAPPNLRRAFFTNSGAEANENALRIACMATGRRKILALTHGFHGRTAAAAAVTWNAAERWYGFPDTPFDVDFIPRDDVDAARSMIDRDVAAVIFEPVQGVAGAYDLSLEFVETLRQKTAEAGAVLIADEVQSGMGRSGQFFAVQAYPGCAGHSHQREIAGRRHTLWRRPLQRRPVDDAACRRPWFDVWRRTGRHSRYTRRH